MNFLLSPEQIEIQTSVARYLDAECPSTRLHELFDAQDTTADPALWQGLLDLGVTALALPEQYGGMGLELVDLALVAEVLGSRAAPTPFLGHVLASIAINLAGNEEQKQRWLPGLADGSLSATMALAEDGDAWQPDQWRIAAGTAITGGKRFVTHAAQADLIVVGLEGGRLAVVQAGAAGLSIASQDIVDRTRPCSVVEFDATPAEMLDGGAATVDRLRDAALVLLAADAYGGASRCVGMAVEYAKLRKQFGVVIGQFQALKHQLADIAVDIEPARGLYWYAAHAWDRLPEQAARSAAQAKAHLADRYLHIARRTVEAHGGIGYTWEFDVQVFLKRAMFNFAWLGSPATHRARAAALAGW
ncbi:MAG: acyl-CoA dehydrogenase family protein [Pseudomonadota bacterium]